MTKDKMDHLKTNKALKDTREEYAINTNQKQVRLNVLRLSLH